ncbi:PAS domain-containing protein [Leifsonia virtsii]|uniref:PAS domain-containing protein n=1 Tax=Leifsonia virtsii TaxID=3035915 RepID=A0ABT8IV62_9MICO|nr:PAS domain-containing protein [Leifsonia virtsii]MDN4596706.1 PAS domain-containing protein [Leifsonia virtsii]
MMNDLLALSDLTRIFDALPEPYVVVDGDRTIVAATDSFLASTGVGRDCIGRDILDVFPDNPDDPMANGTAVLKGAIEDVIEDKVSLDLPPQRYDMEQPDGSFEVRYWKPTFLPAFGDDGDVRYVLHGAVDVTAVMTE